MQDSEPLPPDDPRTERERRKTEIEHLLEPLRKVAMVLLFIAMGLMIFLVGSCFRFFEQLPGFK